MSVTVTSGDGVEVAPGWGRPAAAQSFHFFMHPGGDSLMESACAELGALPWFWERSVPLDYARDLHADGNCLGCRAWLSIPRNRRQAGL